MNNQNRDPLADPSINQPLSQNPDGLTQDNTANPLTEQELVGERDSYNPPLNEDTSDDVRSADAGVIFQDHTDQTDESADLEDDMTPNPSAIETPVGNINRRF